MKLTLHKSRFHSYSVMQWWACSSLMSLLCLQGRIAKVTSGLFYCWSLLRNNTQGNKSSKVDFILRWQAFCCIRLLNADILAGNAARQWHADSGKLPIFILCEKKHEWVYSRATQIFQAKVQSKIVEVRSLLWNHTNVPCLRFFQQKTWNDSTGWPKKMRTHILFDKKPIF